MNSRIMRMPDQCRHRFAGIDARVTRHIEHGYVARCLLCDAVGPVRTNPNSARLALSHKRVRQSVEDESLTVKSDSWSLGGC